MPNAPRQFDVFLAHNSADKPFVEQIAAKLKQRGRTVWLDTEQIPPGRWFHDVIEEGLRHARAIAIIIGPSGVGRFQVMELRAAIDQCLQKNIPVIPVLLPSSEFPENLLFLKQLNWVKVKSLEDHAAIDSLDWGITGHKPEVSFQHLHAVRDSVNEMRQEQKSLAKRAVWSKRWHGLSLAAVLCLAAVTAYQQHLIDESRESFGISKLDSGDWIGNDVAEKIRPPHFAPIANLTVELTAAGNRPVLVILVHQEPSDSEPLGENYIGVASAEYLAYRLRLVRDGSETVGEYKINVNAGIFLPAGMVQFIDSPEAGHHIYSLHAQYVSGTGSMYLSGLRLVAFEL